MIKTKLNPSSFFQKMTTLATVVLISGLMVSCCGCGPRDAKAYFHRGLAYQKKGKWDNAIADYTEAIRLNPNYTEECLYNRGKAYQAKGDTAKAEADFNKAKELGYEPEP